MAISGSFKQQCPSCEAMVPIKDASFVGKKVDCPKCKYRFVVEDPRAKDKKAVAGGKGKKQEEDVEDVVEVEEVEEVKPRKGSKAPPPKRRRDEDEDDDLDDEDEGDAPKAKGKGKGKQKGSNTKLLIGLGLGGVGIVLLIVAGIVIMMVSGGSDKTAKGTGAKQPATQPQPKQVEPVPEDPPIDKPSKKGGKKDNPAKKGGKNQKEPPDNSKKQPSAFGKGPPAGPTNTNFLPPNSEVVYHARMKDFFDSALGKSLFAPVGPLKDADFQKKLGISVLAIDDVLTAESFTENWVFHVVHTTQVINDIQPLIQAMGLKPWQDKSVKGVCYEVPPQSAAWVMTLAKLSLFVPAHVLSVQETSAKAEPLLLHLRDKQTLIFAHREPMLQYLGVDGNFPTTPGGPRTGSFLTLKLPMQELLVGLERTATTDKVFFCVATELRAAKLNGRDPENPRRIIYRVRPFWDAVNLLDETTDRIEFAGTVMVMKDPGFYTFANIFVCNTSAEAQSLTDDLHKQVGPQLVHFLTKAMSDKVELILEPSPNDPKAKPPSKNTLVTSSQIKVVHVDKAAVLGILLLLPPQQLNYFRTAVQQLAMSIKGEAEIASGHDYRFALADAGKTLGQKGLPKQNVPPDTFPQGLFRAGPSPLWTAKEPAHRISWMAGLLPYMGQESLYSSIQFNKAWTDGENWLPARIVVPQFLDPTFPAYSRFAAYPGMPLECAATHYVGISGVGIDSAEAAAGDKVMAGKLGIFGYNRMTPLKMISENGRGLGNTVLMIRVPYDGPAGVTPWMAGGGSTVRDVPEKNSLAPFLSPDSKGELGTYVLMADGSVRYLKKGMSDDVFKAICTVDSPTPKEWKFDSEYPPMTAPKNVAAEPATGKPATTPVESGKPVGTKPETAKKEAPSSTKNALPEGWQEFAHEKGGFTVNLPITAKRIDIEKKITVDEFPLVNFGYMVDKDKTYYLVGCLVLETTPDNLQVDKMIGKIKSNLMEDETVVFKPETQIKLGKVSGREFAFDLKKSKEPQTAYARFFVVQNRLFILFAIAPGITPSSPEYHAFFGSFKLAAKSETANTSSAGSGKPVGSTPEGQKKKEPPDLDKESALLNWTEFSSKDLGFIVKMPEGTVRENVGIGGFPTAATRYGYVYRGSENRIYLSAGVIVFEGKQKLTADEAFEDLKKNFRTGSNIVSEKPITLNMYPGREIVLGPAAEQVNARMSYTRAYYIQGRIYVLDAVASNLDPSSPVYTNFFDSFKLTAK